MFIGSVFRRTSKYLLLTAGIAVFLIPAAVSALSGGQTDIVAAVSAPSPLSQTAACAAAYQTRAGLLAKFDLSRAQLHTLISRADDTLLARLSAGQVTRKELEYRALPNYRDEYALRYQSYSAANPELTPAQVVSHVDMELDLTFYYQPDTVSDPDSLTVLVNKHFALSPDFAPEVEPLGGGYGTGSLQTEAAQAFRAMADAARDAGLTLKSVSSYRSYQTQKLLYARYLAQDSQAVVDDYSARPGHSEHQTGLALDINVARTSAHFETTAEYNWLLEHCAEHGFILRYPKGKEHITGYRFEPWHYRYVGTEIARVCMEQGLTFEEYVAALPAEDANALPALSYNGRFLATGQASLFLDGIHYLAAEELAAELGYTASEMIDGSPLILYRNSRRLTLTPGVRYQADDRVFPLTSPALKLDGVLYLRLEDLCSVLNLALHPTEFGLELSEKHPS